MLFPFQSCTIANRLAIARFAVDRSAHRNLADTEPSRLGGIRIQAFGLSGTIISPAKWRTSILLACPIRLG